MSVRRRVHRIAAALAVACSALATAQPAGAQEIPTGEWPDDLVLLAYQCGGADFTSYRASQGWTTETALASAKQLGCKGWSTPPVKPGQPQSYFSVDPSHGGVVSGGSLPLPHAGDATGDARGDLWVVAQDGTMRFYAKNAGTGYTARGTRGVNLGVIDYLAVTVDMDKDGVADLLFRDTRDQSINIAHVRQDGYLNFGFAAGSHWGSMDTIWYAGKMVAGSNQDYVLARRSDGTLWRYKLVVGKGLVGDGQAGQGWGQMTSMLSPGSINGDGTWDVVGVRKDGRMFAYAVTNGRLGAAREVGHGWTGMRAFTPGDITGDGRLDILGLRTDGTLWSYGNRGDGTWGAATQQLTGLTGTRALA